MHHNSISIEHLSYTYPDGTQALNNICLNIQATERIALVGANGSGKSKLLAHLNGLVLPQQGRVTVGEYPMQPDKLKQIRNFVGLVFQNPDDQLFMPTVWEDVAFGPRNQGCHGEALTRRCYASLNAVGLEPDVFKNRSLATSPVDKKNGWRSPGYWPCSPRF